MNNRLAYEQQIRPFRQSENVKIGNDIAIIANTANMAITVLLLQPLRPLQTFGPFQLVLALEPIVVNTTTAANREIYVIRAIKSIKTIMTITSNAVRSCHAIGTKANFASRGL